MLDREEACCLFLEKNARKSASAYDPALACVVSFSLCAKKLPAAVTDFLSANAVKV